MNFLEIAKKVNTFSGLQGEVDSVIGATGLQATLIELINSSYLEIQLLRDNWKWMQNYTSSFLWGSLSTQVINSGVNTYNSVYNSLKNDLIFVDYYTWVTKSTPDAPLAVPTSYTVIPDTNAIIISPVVDTVTVYYSAVLNPEVLTTNTQVPKMPDRYHMAIVYKAAAELAAILGNSDIYNLNLSRYDVALSQLMRNQNAPLTAKKRPLV